MSTPSIRFVDGAAYERYMGKWSQLAADDFLEWLAPAPGLHWLDVGCGNGAFTECVARRCAPAAVAGVDPSEAQLVYARGRPPLRSADLRRGDAMALPFADDVFDVAVLPLVIFFVPDPARGVGELKRVVRAGGTVAAYAWDLPAGGSPYEFLFAEVRRLGVTVPEPPSPDASRLDALQTLWAAAGLEAVEAREIRVERTFADFEDYWTTVRGSSSVGAQIAALAPADVEVLQARLRTHLPADPDGGIRCRGHANAVRGRVPVGP